jgi:hypothetical protein
VFVRKQKGIFAGASLQAAAAHLKNRRAAEPL